MQYIVNFQNWGSVFAVPTALVDQHLKLAGAVQLKVILWVLRGGGQPFTAESAAKALRLKPEEVNDALQYWVQAGFFSEAGAPSPQVQPETKELQPFVPKAAPQTQEPAQASSLPVRRKPKPTGLYLSERISQSEEIAYLMQEAQQILGKVVSPALSSTLVAAHDDYGLPVEVIIMLLQYAANIGKCNMRYIEKMAISWAEEEITSLALAEKKIDRLTSGRNCAMIVQRTIGLEEHSPTEKEMEFADLWINQWKFTADMIREAYERCVDAKGKYIPKYTSSVLERWYHAGITTVEQARNEKLQNRKSKPTGGSGGAYDIDLFESTSVIDEEW